MKPYVDQDMCIGCGMCAAMAPHVFEMNDENKAVAYSEGDDASVQDAINGCPVGAIRQE